MAKISFGGGGSSSSGGGSVISPTGSVWELYNTADQVTNYEKLKVAWISNVAEIGTLFGGATSARSIQMGASPTGGAPVNTYFRVNPSAPFFTFSRGSSTTGTGFINLSDGVGAIHMAASSSTQIAVDLNPVGAQTATAGVTVLKINPTGTWGSGTRLLIDAQDNSTSKFKVFNTGTIYGSSTSSWALYNTADETTNYERLKVLWTTNVAQIFTQNGGSGTLRNLTLGNATTNAITIPATAVGANGSILTLSAGGANKLQFGVTGTSYSAIYGPAAISGFTYRWATNDTDILYNTGTSGTHHFSSNAGGPTFSIASTGRLSEYGDVATAGWGLSAVYSAGRSTAQTAAVASVATYTNTSADGSYIVDANVLVTTAGSANFTVTCAYTDEGNTARTVTMTFGLVAGGVATTAIVAANGAVPYMGVPLHLRVKASTAITVATTGTFTGCTYNVEGSIRRIA